MQQRSLFFAIFAAGAVGGLLDLLFALAFAGYHGASPIRVFQTIASGLLGDSAFTGGPLVSVLGAACHFGLSWMWAALFAALAWRFGALASRPVLAGAAFGFGVFFCMRLIVLPLSAYPRPVTFPPLASVLDLLSHMFLFGVPIAVIVSRQVRGRNS
jgi:uncharacterized membrane protein YagU involved in acid resistance